MIIRKEAEADLTDGRSWYERQTVGLGDELLEAVEEVLRRINQFPESCQVVHEDFRRARVRRFPFLIYYRIIENEIVVVAVLHSHQNPRVWQARS